MMHETVLVYWTYIVDHLLSVARLDMLHEALQSADTPKSLVFDIDLTLYNSGAYQTSQRQLLIECLASHLGASVQETEVQLRAVRDDFARRNEGRQLSMGNTFRCLGVSISTSIKWREELYKPEDYLSSDRELDLVLAKLSAPFRLAAVTNNPTSIGERTLRTLGVRRHFAPVLGLDLFGESKPTMAPFQMVSAQHGVPLTEMISIGDRMAVDIELPVQHGIGGILVEGVCSANILSPCFARISSASSP